MSDSYPVTAGGDVQAVVARSADAAELFASAPALLLEAQTALGALAGAATGLTNRGRTPFRPDDVWAQRLAELAYRVFLLADQTGVALDAAVVAVADRTTREAQDQAARRAAEADSTWPLRD